MEIKTRQIVEISFVLTVHEGENASQISQVCLRLRCSGVYLIFFFLICKYLALNRKEASVTMMDGRGFNTMLHLWSHL